MAAHWLASHVLVSHITKPTAKTGATVFVFQEPLTAAALVCGSAPATREMAALEPGNSVEKVHGLLISGGSAFGIDACAGLLRFQREQGRGVNVGDGLVVPVCPTGCIFDLKNGLPEFVHPDEVYEACKRAEGIDETVAGSIGAGTGATVSKLFEGGFDPCNGGAAFYTMHHPSGISVTAFVVCNAVGDVYDPHLNQITGPIREGHMYCTRALLKSKTPPVNPSNTMALRNTTIAAIFVNLSMSRSGLQRLCKAAICGFGRTIIPVNTALDGDMIFGFSTNEVVLHSPLTDVLVGDMAAECLENAIRRGVKAANGSVS